MSRSDGSGGAAEYLNELQYIVHLRDSYPQTMYFLQQWQSLYEEYACELCEESLVRLCGGGDVAAAALPRLANDLPKAFRVGRYMACVNVLVGEYRIHTCNFVPIVMGSDLDLRIRCNSQPLDLALRLDDTLAARLGQVFVFDNFWVFSSFISTDARQCHRYRERTKSNENSVRMYIYDRAGKGHMLFIRPNDSALYMRDKSRREVCLIAGNGECEFDDEEGAAAAVARDFAADALVAPFDGLSAGDFFRNCRAYMLHGVGGDDSSQPPPRLNFSRDIDHLDNKRISVAPSLYCQLLRSFERSVCDALRGGGGGGGGDATTTVEQTVRSAAIRYGAMAHRANLLPFISRKTHIRQDWCETMKRQMKSEIRSNRRHRLGAMASGRGSTCAAPCSTNNLIRVCVPNVGQDNTKVSQQFYCSKLHLDVEYDHETVKRMRVVNLNAMNCLRLPTGFERFLSYYNVGNISNAGRVMTRTHGMRESYIPHTDHTISRIVSWMRTYFLSHTTSSSSSKDYTLFSVNDIPILRHSVTFMEFDEDKNYLALARFSLWTFILALKYSQPGCVVVVTHMYNRTYCVNVRVAHGIPLCPVNVVKAKHQACVTSERYARFCRTCGEYRSAACLTFAFQGEDVQSAWLRRSSSSSSSSVLPVCRDHCWFSRHELSLYYQTFRLTEPRPLMHEIACHGCLSVARYLLSTDISKLIVSINAHRRSLDVVDAPTALPIRSTWSRYGDGNGKFTRLIVPKAAMLPPNGYAPRNAIRLMFAFGDLDLLNCEDGYVLNDSMPLLAETLFRKKIVLSCKSGSVLRLVSKMTLLFERDHGLRVHVGTIYSNSRLVIPCGNDVLVYYREAPRRRQLYACDVYLTWNPSFLQLKDCGTYYPRTDSDGGGGGGGGGGGAAAADCLLYEEYAYGAKCPVAATSVEVFDRSLRVSILSQPARQTLKLQNSFGQKGIAHYANLSDLVTEHGESIDVVSSMYSLVGRSACGQIREQQAEGGARKVYSRSTGRHVGSAGYGYFFVSSDSTHNHFIYHTKHGGANPMRMCRLTYEALLENCASSTAYAKGSDFESGTSNPYAGLPRTVRNALDCYGVHRRALRLTSQRTLSLRRNVYDMALLKRLHAMVEGGGNEKRQRRV